MVPGVPGTTRGGHGPTRAPFPDAEGAGGLQAAFAEAIQAQVSLPPKPGDARSICNKVAEDRTLDRVHIQLRCRRVDYLWYKDRTYGPV